VAPRGSSSSATAPTSTAPQLWAYWQPDSGAHGSFFTDWGTEHEVVWRRAFGTWMTFVKAFFDRGGRVTVGTDPGSIFKLFGFNYPEELELLREAGLTPLEVVRAATLNGAELLGWSDRIGTVEAGKLADLVVLAENPLANLKVLYGHGRLRLQEGRIGRAGGIVHTIKDGVVHDARRLLDRVRDVVEEQRQRG
jgi:cytosine/adenosine deaminase-related metal-dependent hydrolase